MSVTVTNWGEEIVYENRGGTERFFAPDTLGSTAMLLDPTGTVTDTFTYWPYGEFISHTGTSSTTFTYVGTLGYYFDVAINSFYVRARIYRQALTRWLTSDPISLSFAPYSYGEQSPVLFVDPLGLIGQPAGPVVCNDLWRDWLRGYCARCRSIAHFDPVCMASCTKFRISFDNACGRGRGRRGGGGGGGTTTSYPQCTRMSQLGQGLSDKDRQGNTDWYSACMSCCAEIWTARPTPCDAFQDPCGCLDGSGPGVIIDVSGIVIGILTKGNLDL